MDFKRWPCLSEYFTVIFVSALELIYILLGPLIIHATLFIFVYSCVDLCAARREVTHAYLLALHCDGAWTQISVQTMNTPFVPLCDWAQETGTDKH